VGEAGQIKLLEAKVLLIGAGGLGSPAAMYLAAAGVGTLGIVDFDVVDVSNLQRQLLHGNKDVGRPKVESAADRIHDINPDVKVVAHNAPLTSENALAIIREYDIVLNGSDNFPTRYLVNDACHMLGKPLVDGSIFMFEGQATVYLPRRAGAAASAAGRATAASILSHRRRAKCRAALRPVCWVCCRASSVRSRPVEAIKLILGIGEPLVGKLVDASTRWT
jgi:molybdopterin/thiamine biosynthesis adenylyltransferase